MRPALHGAAVAVARIKRPAFAARPPYGLASIHVGRYPIGGCALCLELYMAADEMPEPLATLSCNLAPLGVALADDEFCVKSSSENEPLIAPMLATGLFEDTGRCTPTGYPCSRCRQGCLVSSICSWAATLNRRLATSTARYPHPRAS